MLGKVDGAGPVDGEGGMCVRRAAGAEAVARRGWGGGVEAAIERGIETAGSRDDVAERWWRGRGRGAALAWRGGVARSRQRRGAGCAPI